MIDLMHKLWKSGHREPGRGHLAYARQLSLQAHTMTVGASTGNPDRESFPGRYLPRTEAQGQGQEFAEILAHRMAM